MILQQLILCSLFNVGSDFHCLHAFLFPFIPTRGALKQTQEQTLGSLPLMLKVLRC